MSGTTGPGSDRRFPVGLGVVLVLQLAVVCWLLSRSYFFAEDFGQMATYSARPLGWDLLSTSVYGHLVPGLVLAQYVAGGWLGASWTATAALTCLVQLGGTVALARLLVALHGPRWWIPWVAGAFALGVVTLNTAPWWAATLAPQTAVAASLSAWGSALRYDATRRARHLVSQAAMFTVAVAFFEKSVVVSAYVGLFVLVVGTRAAEETWRSRADRARGLWPVWAVFAVISAVDLVCYFAGGYLGEAGEPAGAGQTLGYLAKTLPQGVLPSLVGAATPFTELPGPSWLTPAVASAVALAVVVWTSARSGRARRAWVWFVASALLSQLLVARGRLSLQGTDDVVANLRYQVDPTYLFLIALAVALPAASATHRGRVRRRVGTALALAPLLALPLWVQSVHAISEESPGDDSRAYLEALREGTVPPRTRFLDLAVPGYIVPAPMYPWNLASTVYPVVLPGVTVTHDPEGASWISPDGTVVPLGLTDASSPVRPGCLTSADGPVQVLAAGAAEASAATPPLLLAMSHRADRATAFVLRTGPVDGDADPAKFGSRVKVKGVGELALPIAPTGDDAVFLEVTQAEALCLEDVRLARPVTLAP